MRVKVHKGETVGCVSMKVKDVTRIKIGIGRKIGTQFDYGYTEINGNYAARMHQKKVSMVKYFVFFMLIPAGYFILAAGKKWQEKTDKNICLRIYLFHLVYNNSFIICHLPCSEFSRMGEDDMWKCFIFHYPFTAYKSDKRNR